ncbi:hypothetical protein SLU01_01170 [Sporosarcina luteola]|uniref:Copper amine oxidase-like N-terminal domain-containing protein n=1 Tax=Sporosarcina luteola TaxID=582850 RepID=A0A511Z2Y2_9BACL|nr:DUF6612 family protein [Sporosarcina luteola]GEN81805.1 hypothetical protein SLU01_01170 [Sporosarcina luteola]
MRKVATWVLAFVFVLSFAWPNMTASAQTGSMKLVVDGVEVEGYEQPFMSQEDVLIPVENLFNEAGYQVSKDAAGKVTVTNTYLTVDFSAADEQITVDGEATDALFPLTLKNYGNYVSGEFLNELEGFEVTISEDQQTVNVTTNRVQDVDAFLKKMVAANPNSYAAKMTIDQSMVSDTEELSMDMLMDIDMSITNNPIGLYQKMSMTIGEEEVSTESYFTEDGFFQQDGESWTKLPEELTAGLLEATAAQADPVAQLELTKQFMKGIHIFEYDDAYIITQSMTNEEFQSMMDEAMSLFGDMIPEELFIDNEAVEVTEATDVKEEQKEEATIVEEETATEEAAEEATTDEEVTTEENAAVEEATEETEEETVEGEEIDLDSILGEVSISIDEFFIVTVIDKNTLFPVSTNGKTAMTIKVAGETVTLNQLISGIFSKFNEVKEIKVPEEIIKNAVILDLDSEATAEELKEEAAE